MGFLAEVSYVVPTLWRMLFPSGSKFTADQIPDLTGLVALVTGGNSGIGRETVKALLEHNAKVYLAARSKEKAEEAIKQLKEETGKEAVFLELDLSRLASVRRAAEEFLSKEPELHVLFNNAGVMVPPIDAVTADGYDLQFGTNVVGHFIFTEHLMSALISGAATAPDHHARIVTTSSAGAMFGGLNWETFMDGPARHREPINKLYFQSKLANVIVARQIAKRYADRGIVSISVDPGLIQTDLYQHALAPRNLATVLTRFIMKLLLYPASFGARTQLWAGTMPEALQYNGEYIIPVAKVGRCREEAYDDELGQKLWTWLEMQGKRC